MNGAIFSGRSKYVIRERNYLLPMTDSIRSLLKYSRKYGDYHTLYDVEDEEVKSSLRELVTSVTRERCTQETFSVELTYDANLNNCNLELILNSIYRDSQGRYT